MKRICKFTRVRLLFVLLLLVVVNLTACNNKIPEQNSSIEVGSTESVSTSSVDFVTEKKCLECDEIAISGTDYCIQHKCVLCDDVRERDSVYCVKHKCSNCDNKRDGDSAFCSECKQKMGLD